MLVLLLATATPLQVPEAAAQPVRQDQTTLGPGLYVFQTRTRSATCGDDFQTGFVSSFYAAINGVPGAARMEMRLLNNEYWPVWNLRVDDERVFGAARMQGRRDRPIQQRFQVTRQANQFEGTGTRQYITTIDGERQRCEVTVDVLLRRLDQ